MNSRNWYEEDYQSRGVKSQRRWPNTDAVRFVSKYFPLEQRSESKILELGSGTGPNLWMLCEEGFQSYGIDFSHTSVKLAEKNLSNRQKSAVIKTADMRALPFGEAYFNGIIDVFSSYAMTTSDFVKVLAEIERVLKPGGYYFSHTPSDESDAFKNYLPAIKIDDWTLDGIKRETSPYFGNNYPFRFLNLLWLKEHLKSTQLSLIEVEKLSRFQNGESFVFYNYVLKRE